MVVARKARVLVEEGNGPWPLVMAEHGGETFGPFAEENCHGSLYERELQWVAAECG